MSINQKGFRGNASSGEQRNLRLWAPEKSKETPGSHVSKRTQDFVPRGRRTDRDWREDKKGHTFFTESKEVVLGCDGGDDPQGPVPQVG